MIETKHRRHRTFVQIIDYKQNIFNIFPIKINPISIHNLDFGNSKLNIND